MTAKNKRRGAIGFSSLGFIYFFKSDYFRNKTVNFSILFGFYKILLKILIFKVDLTVSRSVFFLGSGEAVGC